MTIPSKFGSNWATGSRQDGFLREFPIGSYVKLSSAVQPFWSEGGTTRHKFGRGPSNDYFLKVWFQLSNWFQTRRFVCEFPIGSYVKLSSAVGAILVEGPNRLTYFWKRTIQWLHCISSPLFSISSLVAILVGSWDHRTHFWKGVIQGLFHQSLVAIGPVVSEEKIFMWISHRVLC